jgi:hypothetical protein
MSDHDLSLLVDGGGDEPPVEGLGGEVEEDS